MTAEMMVRLITGLAALASYYLLVWFAGGVIATAYPHAMEHMLVAMAAGAALGAALPVGFVVFQVAARAADRRRARAAQTRRPG